MVKYYNVASNVDNCDLAGLILIKPISNQHQKQECFDLFQFAALDFGSIVTCRHSPF